METPLLCAGGNGGMSFEGDFACLFPPKEKARAARVENFGGAGNGGSLFGALSLWYMPVVSDFRG